VDLAVIGGLVDDVTVEAGPHGCRVRMAWPVAAPGKPAVATEPGPAAHDEQDATSAPAAQ
jgi:hypothetical protein